MKKTSLECLLDEITPLEQAKTDAKMILAVRIAEAMQAKNWKHKDLLAAIGKDNPSIVTKWLSGTHNFTVETLVELEHALEVSLLGISENTLVDTVHYQAVVRQEVSTFDYLSASKQTTLMGRYRASIRS
jgi:transcriptional regulator with XRE-family HTH domain